MKNSPENVRHSPGFWRVAWSRYRRYKLGMLGLMMVLTLMFVGFFAPFLSNDEPIVCRYDGKIHFPASMSTAVAMPKVTLTSTGASEFGMR